MAAVLARDIFKTFGETHAVDGRRISNSSAERLRYFGRVFFAAALDIEGNSIIASQRSNSAM